MASSPREILGHLASAPSITGAMIVQRDGSVVAQALTDGINPDTVRAIARDLLPQWESAGSDLKIGRPRTVLVETACGPLSIMPVGVDAFLVVVGDAACRLGRIRRQMQRAQEASPEAPPGPHHDLADLHRMLAATPPDVFPEEAPPRPTGFPSDEERGNGWGGEVVVIGVSTFRLTARLVAALAHARGVRAARLRTYAPDRVTIDVAFEEGGTLASIAAACLDEHPLEVIECSDARLLLGVSTPARSAMVLNRVP
jgi:predicted regulator of Ras-like GTPase activity (Roadblock/LC7/MglB family)